MAAEAADEDDEKAHTFYHHTNPLGYWGYAPRGSSLSWVFLLVASTIPPPSGVKKKQQRR